MSTSQRCNFKFRPEQLADRFSAAFFQANDLIPNHQYILQKMAMTEAAAGPRTRIASSTFNLLQAPQYVQRSVLLAFSIRELLICGQVGIRGP